MSRRLVTSLFHSLDGIASEPHRFQFDSFDDELGAWMSQGIAAVDDCILGRTTYTEWAGYWPDRTSGEDSMFAEFINDTPKHVASTTLKPEDLDWANSTLITGDLVDYVQRLKDGEGGDIAVQGSLSVLDQLLDAELVDALTLAIHPVVAGEGRRIFNGSTPRRLTMIDVQRTSKDNLLVTYGPRPD